MPRKPRQTVDDATACAIEALTFLAEDQDRLTRFLGLSGLAPDDLRRTAGEPATLAAVLEYLLADESLLLVFTANAGIPPESVATARDLLSGPPPAWD